MTAPAIAPPETDVPAGWRGVLAPVNVRSGDGRELVLDGEEIPTRPLPLPISAQKQLAEGHDGSVVVGLITRVWLENGMMMGEGTFDLDDPDAVEWASKLARGVAGWVSVDLSDLMIEDVPLDSDGNEVPGEAFEGVDTPDDPANPVASWLMRVTEWKLMGVTLVSSPAFEQAKISPAADVASPASIVAAAVEHTGAMVALIPSAEDAALLTVGGYEPIEELHLTLAFLGEASAWTPEQQAALVKAIGDYTAGSSLVGDVFAHASFNPAGDQPCAVYLVNGDGLTDLRAAVWSALDDTDTPEIPENHPVFIPHVTAGYGLDVAQLEYTGPIRFDRIRVAFAGENTDIPLDAVTASLTASAVVYDAADFALPEPDELTAITVTDDGRVYGHLAESNSCHIGFADVCVSPPKSMANYAYFHQGEIATTDGPLAVGKITLGTGHANLRAGARPAAEHYDNTGTAVAVVRCNDGKLGPWLSGRILPGVGDDRIDELRRSGISGDWRGVNRSSNLELVAVLAVNVPGFPVPRTRVLAASGARTLIASAHHRSTPPVDRARLDAVAARAHNIKIGQLARRIKGVR